MDLEEASERGPGFDVYGYRFRVRSDSASAEQGLASDFGYFKCDPVAHAVSIEICETAYLFVLSQIAEHLDNLGLHRVHALGVTVEERAVLVMLSMGGGKSTLCAGLLQHPEMSLLSDDSPFIDRKGQVYAFPTRIAILPGNEDALPSEHVRRIDRMEFGPKFLLDYSYFADRVVGRALPGHVFIGARNATQTCRIQKCRRGEALRAMLANCVVGLGLFQGMEFVFQRSPRELVGKIGVALSRLRCSLALLRRSEVHHLSLGRNGEENIRRIMDVVRGNG